MIGRGPGWDNGSYLDNLGGDESDRDEANKKYNEFRDTRQAFEERQEKLLKTEQGQRFMQQQRMKQQSAQQAAQEAEPFGMYGGVLPDDDESGTNVGFGSGGGSRMRNMMRRSEQMKGHQKQVQGQQGLGQGMIFPLEDDDVEGSIQGN